MGMILEAGKHILADTHHADKIEGYQSTGHTQQHAGWDTLHGPLTVEMEREQRRTTAEDIGEASGCDTGYEDRQQGRHRHIDHQHLEGEHQSGDGCLEDASNGTCRTAAYERHQHLTVEVEDLPQVGAYGRAREHDRCLGSH